MGYLGLGWNLSATLHKGNSKHLKILFSPGSSFFTVSKDSTGR